MGIFKRKESRDFDASLISAGDFLAEMRGIDTVTIEDAMQVPCFAACVSYISGTIAMLPIKLYRDSGDAAEEITDDPRLKLLNDETGDLLDSYQMKAAIITDYLIYGGGYAYIERNRNNFTGLYYVDVRNIGYNINADPIYKTASYLIGGKSYRTFEVLALLRKTKNGVFGQGIFGEAKETIATAYNTKVYQHNTVRSGGHKNGYLQANSKLAESAMDLLRRKWAQFHSNYNSDPMVLNSGIEFKETSATSVEMQLNEHIKTNNEEICLLFGLSPEIISGSATTEQYADATKTAIIPIVESLQAVLNKTLLLESEKGKLYFSVDTSELLKGDILKRYQAYQIALQSNIMQIDEVRYREDLPRLGFNYIKLGLQDVLLDVKSGTVYTPNTNQTAKIGEKTIDNGGNGGIIGGIEDVEDRFNELHDWRNGQFAFKPIYLDDTEKFWLSSHIASDFPSWKEGERRCYEHGDHFYAFIVNGLSDYYFFAKIEITDENRDAINDCRKGIENGTIVF